MCESRLPHVATPRRHPAAVSTKYCFMGYTESEVPDEYRSLWGHVMIPIAPGQESGQAHGQMQNAQRWAPHSCVEINCNTKFNMSCIVCNTISECKSRTQGPFSPISRHLPRNLLTSSIWRVNTNIHWTLTSIIKSLCRTISVSSNVIHLLTLHVTLNFPKFLTSMSLHLLH